MNRLEILGGIIGLCAYIPIGVFIFQDKKKGIKDYSFASFILWAVLDGIACTAYFLQKGDYILPGLFTLGSMSISILLLALKQIKWGGFEYFILALVVICIIVWFTSGPYGAAISSTIAVGVAGIPQLISVILKPKRKAVIIWTLFTLANLAFYFSKPGDDIDSFILNRFYPLTNGIFSFILIFLSFRHEKTLQKNT